MQRWGVEVEAVELKDLDIPEQMQRAIAREAEAIREKRARIIKAEGEMEAAATRARPRRDRRATRPRWKSAGSDDLRGRRRAQQHHGADH